MDMSTLKDTWLDLVKKVSEEMGSYTLTPLIVQFIGFLISNRYEGEIVVDREGRIAFVDKLSERVLGFAPGEAEGQMLNNLFPDALLTEVAKTGIPQIGRVQTVMGVKSIVSRMPLYKDGQLIGAVGKVIIHDLDVIKNLSMKIKQLETKVDGYRQEITTKNKARYTFNDIIGISQSIHETKELARKIAKTNSTVLLTGGSGTRKELFAHSIPRQAIAHRDRLFESTVRAFLSNWLKVSFSAMKRVPLPGRTEWVKRGNSNLPRAELFFWTKSPPCRWISRQSCSESSRKRSYIRLDRQKPGLWISD